MTEIYCDILWYIAIAIILHSENQYDNFSSTLLRYCDNIELLPSPSHESVEDKLSVDIAKGDRSSP